MPESERRPVAAILFDLDHFGSFNKLHGVQVGDQALRVFAHVMRERTRQTDLVARFGGEEFVVVLDGADRDQAVSVAEEVRQRLGSRTIPAEDGAPLRLTVSAGCAALDDAEPTAEALLRTADVASRWPSAAGATGWWPPSLPSGGDTVRQPTDSHRVPILDVGVGAFEQLIVDDRLGDPDGASADWNAAAPRSRNHSSLEPASIQIPDRPRSASAWPGTIRTGSRASHRSQTSTTSRPVAGSKGRRMVPSASVE